MNFKNLLYDLYSKDLSVKIKASLRSIKEQGKYVVGSEAPFGYAKDPEKWIITENHHEPIVDRETFDRVQARFGKRKHSWKRKDGHVLVDRMKCGCCGRNLRHSVYGHPYYWCARPNIYNQEGCVADR